MKSLFLCLFACCIVLSCETEDVSPKTGNVEFVFSETDALSGGRIKTSASSLIISIEKEDGESVYERKNIPLYQFNGEYLSEPIALTTGNYKLTEFIVLDANGTAIYASPVEGSPLAYLIEDALPVNFSVSKDATTKVSPEVIKVEGNSSTDFGYTTFEFNVVETFTFKTGIMAYNSSTQNFELTPANMQITVEGDVLFDTELAAITNAIRIKDGFDNYTIKVTKDGYTAYQHTFSADSLKDHVTGSPLVIVLLQASLSEGLVAYYPFNGNANDQTASNLDGIVHDAVLTTDRKGVADAAYLFDGLNDHIQVPHNELLNLAGDYSISLWTKIAGDQEPQNGINDILRKWNGDAQGYPFSISYLNPLADDAHEDKIIYTRYDGSVCMNTTTTYSPLITNDTFIHIVMVKENDKIRTFLNNELIAEVNDITTCSTANTADMTIGSRGNLVRFFKGKIDDIRIYGRALSQDEVANLFGE